MKIATFDSGLRWDAPNLRWDNTAPVQEPGDPGYITPLFPSNPPKTYRTMSHNQIPTAQRPLLALAENCTQGCAVLENSLPLKLVRQSDLRLSLTALKGDPTATPPVLGLLYQFKQAELTHEAMQKARKDKNVECRIFLTAARASLISILGRDASLEWAQAGFTNPPTNSNAVPNSQEGRLHCLSALANYLTQHPNYENPTGGPRPEVTAARAQALHQELSACRHAANAAANDQEIALQTKLSALKTLRAQLMALVDELQLRLSDDDPRWEVFGLNIPADPRAPEPATDLILSPAGPGRIAAEWQRGMRSSDDRILIKVHGTDTDFRVHGKSGGDSEELLKNLTSGSTIEIMIIALNGDLEAPTGPVAQIVVP